MINKIHLFSADNQLECELSNGSLTPQIMLLFWQSLPGFFAPLYDSLGTAYMDDNIQKSKTPLYISASYCMRMLGPALGYSVASYSLNQYIEPELTPTIDVDDQRWLGAWWLGLLFLFVILSFSAFFLSLFPRELPRAYLRRLIKAEQLKATQCNNDDKYVSQNSLVDGSKMKTQFKRVLTNRIFMLNTSASVFYFFGFMSYWVFTPKYIETMYRQSASTSRYFW